MMGVGIIGAGLIGGKRAAHMKGAKLVAVADLIPGRAQRLADLHHAEAEKSWESLVKRKDIDLVIISTTNDALAPCAVASLGAGKNVLIEKPAARSIEHIEQIIAASKISGRVARVGFNHRFHPAFQLAKRMIEEDRIGPLMYIRARYGHGGRLGYEKEWRADPRLSGGGELLDQGIHLIDLCRWLGGDFELEWGKARTFFWNMPVEDNGFLLLRSPDGLRSAFLHASCTEWKNLFDFEIFGRTGKLEIYGLGRSYGVEELRYYRMKPEMGPPETVVTPFPEEDRSWQAEFDAFLRELNGQSTSIGTLEDAARAMEIVQSVYAPSCSA